MKYADGNWRKGGKPDREYLDSMMRHLTLWIHGEVYDDDSGCSHLGHAIWNLMALHELNHPDEIIDDQVFKRQCAHWKAEKEKRTLTIPADSGLTKKTDSGEKQKEEEGLQEDDTDIEISFVVPNNARYTSFKDITKRLMAQDLEVKLRDAFFNYLGDVPRCPRKGEVE